MRAILTAVGDWHARVGRPHGHISLHSLRFDRTNGRMTLVDLGGAPRAEHKRSDWAWTRLHCIDEACVRARHVGAWCSAKTDWIEALVVAHDWTRRRTATVDRTYLENTLWSMGNDLPEETMAIWAALAREVDHAPDDKYPEPAAHLARLLRLLPKER